MTHHDLVLPLRTPTALREEVAGRVARRRRQRARRRALRLAFPAAAAFLAFVVGADGVPGLRTGVHTIDGRADPAADGPVELEAGRAGGSARPVVAPDDERSDTGPAAPTTDARRPASGSSPTTAPVSPPRPGTGDRAPATAPDVRLAVTRPDGIWELDADGADVRKLVDRAEEPAWSPDGRRLAYAKQWEGVNGGMAVAVLDLATMRASYLLASSQADYRTPAWSPDGRRLVAARIARPPDLQASLVVVEVDSRTVDSLGPGDWPSWGRDGRLLLRCGGRLCVRSADGTTTAPIPDSDDLVAAAWSPDGDWVVGLDARDLVVLRVEGSGRRTIAEGATGAPAWSPDGARIVHPTAAGLRSVQTDGSDVRVVTDRPLDADPDLVAVRR